MIGVASEPDCIKRMVKRAGWTFDLSALYFLFSRATKACRWGLKLWAETSTYQKAHRRGPRCHMGFPESCGTQPALIPQSGTKGAPACAWARWEARYWRS